MEAAGFYFSKVPRRKPLKKINGHMAEVHRIFLNFKTEQLASLIFNSRNFKVLELLQIKTHQFLRNGGDGAKLPDSSDKGFNVGNPALTLRVATTRLYGFCLRNGV